MSKEPRFKFAFVLKSHMLSGYSTIIDDPATAHQMANAIVSQVRNQYDKISIEVVMMCRYCEHIPQRAESEWYVCENYNCPGPPREEEAGDA